MTPELAAELDAALNVLRAKHPGITREEAAQHLPPHLAKALWERVVGGHLNDELAKEKEQ